MPKSPDDYQPTEADLDLVIEVAAGKPVNPADLVSGIASLCQRITQLEAEKARLLDQLDYAKGEMEEAQKKYLAVVNKDLATARERLVHYEAQLDTQN